MVHHASPLFFSLAGPVELSHGKGESLGRAIDEGVYVREYYQIPAHVGQRIEWRGQPGTIIGFDLAYLRVELDADPLEGAPEVVVVHPTWEVRYPESEEVAHE